MLRLLKAAGVFALASSLLAQPVQAESVGNWTLNINNRFGALTVPAGGVLPYDVRITNDQNFDTPAGRIDFTIPATTIYRGVVGLDNCAPAPNGDLLAAPLVVTCDVPVLTTGQNLSAEVVVSPMRGDCGGGNCVIELKGRVYNPAGSPPDDTIAGRPTTITVGADLEFGIELAETTAQAGSRVQITATVTNNGPYPSTSSQVVLPLPTGLADPQLPSGCSLSGGNIICSVPDPLEPGESHAFNLSAQVTAGTVSTITIAGRVEGAAPRDPVSENDNDHVDLSVTEGTDVRLQKARSPGGLILVGDAVSFTLTPTYSGFVPQSASITDTIPDNYDIGGVVVQTGSGWVCGRAGRTVTCDYTEASGSNYATPIVINAVAVSATGADGVINTAAISSPDENADAGNNNHASDLTAHIAEPIIDLKANKEGPPRRLVTVGNEYDYRLSATNIGNKTYAGEVTITDRLPEGLTVTRINAPAGWLCSPSTLPIVGSSSGTDIVCTTDKYGAGGIAPGATTDVITLTAKVTQAGSITNGMTVSFPDYLTEDNDPGNNTVYEGVTSADKDDWANIGIEKCVSAPSILAGDEITFTIEVYNQGPATATTVKVADRIDDIVSSATGGKPADITPVINWGSALGGSCSSTPAGDYGRNLECDIGTLPVCERGVNCPKIQVTVRPGSQGSKTNVVNAYSLDIPDNDLSDNESSVGYTVNLRTDVLITKTSPAGYSGAYAGQELTYTLTALVPDTGLSHAENVTITDTLPEDVLFIRAQPSAGSCSVAPNPNSIVTAANKQVVCNLGTINNGSQKTLTVVVMPMSDFVGQKILNRAGVTTTTPETNGGNNDAQLDIAILPPHLDLVIDKTDDPFDPVEITTPVTYTISLKNAGPSDAFNIVITDQLPLDGFTKPVLVGVPAGLNCTMSGTSTTAPGGQIVCTLERLKAGDTISFKVQMDSFRRGRWENVVSVSSDEVVAGYEGPTTNNVAREDTTVRTRADISVTKTPSVTQVDLRKEFYWDIVVTNEVGEGLDVAEEVTLADTLPQGMELTRVPEITPSGAGTCTGAVGQRQINCEFGDIDPGVSITVRLYTKITDTNAQAASNTATVNTKSFDKKPGNNTSTGSVTTVRGSTVSGKVFKDYNNNGTLDQTDQGIGGAQVTITGTATHDGAPVNITIPTNADGTYSFTNLPPGTYEVSYTITNPGDYSSDPGDGQSMPGANPPANGTAASDGKTVIKNIVTVGDYNHQNNDFTLVPLPKIGLGKTVSAATFQPDGSYTINYTIKVRNHSGEPLASVDLTDVMSGASQRFGTAVAPPATLAPGQYKVLNIVGTGITANAGFDGSATPLLVTAGTLAVGQTATITFTVQVKPPVPWVGTSTTHTNQAEVTATGEHSGKTTTDRSHNTAAGQDTPERNTPTSVAVTPSPKIELTKAATPVRADGRAEVGDRINYSFTVRNAGNVSLVNITLSDPLPGLQGLTPTSLGGLEPGETYSGTITAYYELTQADLDRGYVRNTATVAGQWGIDGTTPLTVEDQKTANVPSLSDPKIELVKDIAQNNIQNPRTEVGDTVRYSFTVTNTGNTNLKNVNVSDLLPGVTPDPAGSFAIGNMAPDAEVTVYGTYAIKQVDINAGTVNNTATAAGTYGPNDTPIESDPSTREVATYREPRLALTKALVSAEPANPRAGDTLEWTVTAENTGNVTIYNVTVTDPLAGATIAPAAVASLQPGQSATFTVRAPILQSWINAGGVSNTATASFEDPTGPQDPVPSNRVEVPLPSVPSIALKKTASLDAISTPPAKDDVIHYTFTIRNTGNVPLRGLTLVDELNVSDDEVVVSLNAADMAALAAATLQPLGQIVVRGTYALTQDDIDRGSISNMARATGTPIVGPDDPVEDASGTDFDNDNPTTNPLTRDPQIRLVKTISIPPASTPAEAGDVVTYAFKIVNTGNIALENIRIEDVLGGITVTNPTGWTGPLAPGDTNEDAFVATYTLTQSDIDRGSFANTAEVIGSSVGGSSDDVRDTSGTDIDNDTETTLTINRAKAITVVKSADNSALQSPPRAGDPITYTFLVTNTGNVTLTDVVLTDNLAGIVLDEDTIATLLPGAANAVTLTGTYAITQDDIQAGKVLNKAFVNGTYTDPETGDEEDVPGESEEIEVPLTQLPRIAVVKEQDVDNTTLTEPAEPGQIIAYTFTVVNTGNLVLTGIVLEDPLDGISPNQFTIAELLPGAEQKFTATYAIVEGDIDNEQVINQATVRATHDDGTGPKEVEDLSGPTVDEDDELIVPVIPPEPLLTIVKTGVWKDADGNGYPTVGETIEYTFQVTNDGNATLYNVRPSDEGPAFNGRPATNPLSGFSPEPVTLAPKQSQTFTATYVLSEEDIDAAAGVREGSVNTAKAVGNLRNGHPYESEPAKALVSLPATEPTDVRLSKQALLHQVKRGDRVPYVIKVENTSSRNAGPVNVIDTMPSGFRFIAGTATVNGAAFEPQVDGRRVRFDYLTLGSNGTIEIRLDLLVLSSAGPGKHVNTASVTDRDGTPVVKDAHASVEIVAEPVFDCSEVIGTVFDDIDRNGYQDDGEPGLPGVRVVTAKGWLITTDRHGRFHVPCAALPDQRIGSNFIMKLDTRTLPTGYRLTTENPRVVRLTAGKMTKLNFGASISRVIRLDLQSGAFRPDSVELDRRWAANLDQLIVILRQEPSVLRLSFAGSASEAELARKRVAALRERIADLWKKNGASYELEIETRVESGQ